MQSRAQCKVPGFEYAAFGDLGVSMGNGNVDSYNSASGSYATTKCTTSPPCVGGVGTNNSASGGVSLGPNASVKGGCQIGAGGTTANITPNSSKCDSLSVESSTLSLPIPTLPSTLAGSYGAISNNLTIPGPGAYSMTSLSLSGNKALAINSGPVVIYLTGSGSVMSLSGNATVNNNTQLPKNLVFMCTSTSTPQSISVVGNGNAYYAIYCPLADITITGNGTIYGAIVGKSVNFNGNNGYVHYDKALANFTSNAISCGGTESSRASPVIASLSPTWGGVQTSLVQGTFVTPSGSATTITSVASIGGFSFPYITGHMRARMTSSITTTASSFAGTVCTGSGTPSGCSVLFDVGATGAIPAASTTCTTIDGTCRYVFTNTNAAASNGTTLHPTTLPFTDANADTIGPLIAAASQVPGITTSNWRTIMGKVRAGKLGGVDRSTVAVIGASALAGSSRPTMAYFGAADGMLHAVCASTSGACSGHFGQELWAFIPRVELPLIRTNSQRIDGSVTVLDVFGDFNNPATGIRSWKTILTFQTGYGASGASPAAYAFDITNPTAPVLLWEYTKPTSPAAKDFGIGLTVAAGPAIVSGQRKNMVVLETSNGGSGTTGVVWTALAQETGEELWQRGYVYPSPPRGNSGDNPLPSTGIPGGAVGVDLVGSGYVTDYVFGDLYGDLWLVSASTGLTRTASDETTPLFSFSSNKHAIGAPPAIYSNGSKQFAAFVSGGYADATASSWSTTTQYIVAVKLDITETSTVTEASTACLQTTCPLAVNTTLAGVGAAGDKGFAQVLVVGNQLFVTTDSADVSSSNYGTTANTGHLTAIDLSTGQATSAVVINSGGSSLVASSTTLFSSSATKQQRTSTNAISTTGTRVDLATNPKLQRVLWLRTE